MLKTLTRTALIATCVLALSGCLRPYKMDIQQGNIVTQDMIDKLKPGMSQREVRFVLGSPMIEDPFHANRWDYAYVLKKGRDPNIEKRVVTVLFEDGKLASVDGDAAVQVESEREKLTNPKSLDPKKAKKRKGRFKDFWKKVKEKATPKKKS